MSQKNRPSHRAQRLIEQEEQHFSRATRTRRTVLEAIAGKEDHFTAEELAKELSGVGRATVYRTLAHLVDEGTVCRVPVESGTVYRLGPQTHHHHLICQVCGQVQDIAGCGVDEFVADIGAKWGFQVTGHRLEIYGRCRRCADAA